MIYLVVVIAMLFCGIMAIRADRLMISALWLAGVSALMAVLLYAAGAHEVAVIELSVGAGLVTVLLVFAISLAGDEPLPARSVVPLPVALVLVAAFVVLLVLFALPLIQTGSAAPEVSFTQMFWHVRSADTLAQIVLIFTGALSVLGFLVERREKARPQMISIPEAPIKEEQR